MVGNGEEGEGAVVEVFEFSKYEDVYFDKNKNRSRKQDRLDKTYK